VNTIQTAVKAGAAAVAAAATKTTGAAIAVARVVPKRPRIKRNKVI
jgi:hypothetical protein